MLNLSSYKTNHKKPIICFDLDGTLLNNRDEIHPVDREILRNERAAVIFIPTTGRTLESIKRTFCRNELFENMKIPFPLVLQNGSLLYKEYEALLSFHPFSPETQNSLIEVALKFPRVTFLFMGATETHTLSTTSTGSAVAQRYEFTTHLFTPASWSLPFSKIMCIPESPTDLDGLFEKIDSLPIECAYSTPTILELTPKGINKAIGLSRLITAMDLSPSQVLAAGDAENDLPLTVIANQFFAPPNALDSVKSKSIELNNIEQNGLLTTMMSYLA